MKNKNFKFIVFLVNVLHSLILTNNIYSSNSPELYIRNFSTNNVTIDVKIYPISMVFNGNLNYDLLAQNRELGFPYNFINSKNFGSIDPMGVLRYNHDYNTANNANIGAVGFGVYKVEISGTALSNFFDTCTVEWDFGWSIAPPPFGADLSIIFRDDLGDPRITFVWAGGTETRIDDSLINKKIQAWNQPGNESRPKLFGDFTYDVQNLNASYPPDRDYNLYSVLPQDSRIDCNRLLYNPDGSQFSASENQNYGDNRFGTLTQNLTINKNVTTRNEATPLDITTYLNVTSKTFLKLNSDIIFHMLEPQILNQGFYTNLIIQDSASLILKNNAKIIVEKENKITLKPSSKVTLLGYSEIRIKNGAVFCNEGGLIRGPGKIVFDKGIYQLCSYFNDFVFEDSAKIILEDSAVVILPDNYTLRLRGNTTSLIMKPGSKMMFGENSGIVCDSGAKVIANNAVFTSADSTKMWNGISLKHRSQDTIKSCIIKNADFGVNIMNKNDDEETEIPYSTEISGCSFINQTSHVLNNAIYAAGSSKLLISNNV